MNMLTNANSEYYNVVDGSVDQLVAELSDPSSLWHDLKLAEMSGFDYIFAPDAICYQLSSLKALTDFFSKLETILGADRSRTILISYWHDQYRQLHFEKFALEWSDEIAITWERKLLDESLQLDFISTIFDHSESLVETA